MGDLARPDLLHPLIHLADGVVQRVADSDFRGGAFVLVLPERIAHDEKRSHPCGKTEVRGFGCSGGKDILCRCSERFNWLSGLSDGWYL